GATVRPVHSRHGLSAGGGKPLTSAVPNSVGREARTHGGAQATDLSRCRNDTSQAHGPRRRRQRDQQGFLPGFPAGQERRGSYRLPSVIQESADLFEYGAKHLGREQAWARVEAGAVIAAKQGEGAELIPAAMFEAQVGYFPS